jgi:hypothetical protein
MYQRLRSVMQERLGFGPYYVLVVMGTATLLFALGTVPMTWITILAVPSAIGLTAGIYRCWCRTIYGYWGTTWRTPDDFVAAVRKAARK